MSTKADEWAINESLLQSYRSIFISSQSFLLAVGALVLDKSTVLVVVTASVGLVMTWLIWFPVVRSRHLLVDYYKFDISSLCGEHDYVHSRARRTAANKEVNLRGNWRPTRVKIDAILPALFTTVWIAQLLYVSFA